jgi:hypothetical protein
MSRATASATRRWRTLVVVGACAVALASCGTPHVVTPHIIGTPSSSIDVPLGSVACTTSGSCIAVGGDASNVAPSSVAEVRHANGTWAVLTVPDTLSQSITSASCWSDGCLVGGAQSSLDSIWNYLQRGESLDVATAPHAGRGVSAIDCFASASCAVVDSTGIVGSSRLAFTSNAASTWSVPTPITWTLGDAVTALSCTDALDCLVAATTSTNQAVLEATHDGGTTWIPRTVPSTWRTLTSLTCEKLNCVALATTSTSSLIARTSTFGRVWRSASLANVANSLACVRLSRCVVAGATSSQEPWLATLKGLRATTLALKYVPSPLIDAACSVKVCAAVAPSTVLSFGP